MKRYKKQNHEIKKVITGGLIPLSCMSIALIENIPDANAVSAIMPIKVNIVRAIDLTVNASMDFGTLAITADMAGEIRLDPESNTLIADSNNSLALAGGQPTAGRLTLRASNLPVSVSIESTSINMTNGVDSLTVMDFNFLGGNPESKITITPSAGVSEVTIPVGATLKTKVGQLVGTYVGATKVFASFQ